MVKHLKGEFENLKFKLMDEDTFSRDDHVGTGSIPFSCFSNEAFSNLDQVLFDGTIPMLDNKGTQIGTLRVNVEYCPGDVGLFQSLADHFHI